MVIALWLWRPIQLVLLDPAPELLTEQCTIGVEMDEYMELLLGRGIEMDEGGGSVLP